MAFSISLKEFNPAFTFSSGHVFYVWQEGEEWVWPTRGKVCRFRVKGDVVACVGASEDFFQQVLGLEEPYPEILEKLAGFPGLGNAVERFEGLRLLRQDPWECTLGFLNATLSSVVRVRRHLGDLAREFGREIKGVPQLPSPSQLPGEAKLREMGLGYRAKFIDQVSRLAAGDSEGSALQPYDREESAIFRSLASVELEATLKNLQELPGVGRKVASCIALYSLDHQDALPVDVWIERGLRQSLKQKEEVSAVKLEALARKKLSPWAGYGQQFLYQALREK